MARSARCSRPRIEKFAANRSHLGPSCPDPLHDVVVYSEEYPHLVRSREPLVELPSLGRPTADERNWRRLIRRSSEAWPASLRAITFERWGEHLAGDDIPWALRAVRYLRHIVARHEQRIVLLAVERGFGWDEIGSYLGVSRQAVAERFGKLIARAQDEVLPDPPVPRKEP